MTSLRTSLSALLIVAAVMVVVIPLVFRVVYGAEWELRTVDRDACYACPCQQFCFDGRYKGNHARDGYRHVWFNMTLATGVLLVWSLFWIWIWHAVVVRVIELRARRSLRLSAAVMVGLLAYPCMYGAWCVWNYVNEAVALRLLDNQLFFCCTSAVMLFCAAQLLDSSTETPRARFVLAALACAHILLACYDQWADEGYLLVAPTWVQFVRDLFMMAPNAVIAGLQVVHERGKEERFLAPAHRLRFASLVLGTVLVGNLISEVHPVQRIFF